MRKGFTLIELLVVMGVFLAVSVVVGGILFSTLRGSEKTATLDQVRQNGDFALSVMARQIRNAKSLNSPTNCWLTPTPTPVSQITFNPAGGGNQTIFTCNYGNPPTIASNSSSLLDTTKVSLTPDTCSFTCTQASSSQPPTIKIKFRLSQSGAGSFVESAATVDFETSVTLRNQ